MNAEKKTLDGREIRVVFVDIMKDYNSGDMQKKADAIEQADKYLDRFVWNVINKYYNSYGAHREDLHSEGRLGWISAMDGYDPMISAPTTYFFHHIIHYIQTYIDDNIMHMTTYYNSTAKILKKIISELDATGIVYDECLLAERAKLPLETVKNTLMHMNNSVQVSFETGIMSQISEMYETPEAKVLREEAEAEIDNMMSDLSPRDAEIFSKLNGLDGERYTSKEIAERLSCLSKESREKYGVTATVTDDPRNDMKVAQFKVLLENCCNDSETIMELFVNCVDMAATSSAKTAKTALKMFESKLKEHCSAEDFAHLDAILVSERLIRQRMAPVTKAMVNAINKRVIRQLRGRQTIIEHDIAASYDIDECSMDEIHQQMDYMEQISIEELMIE